MADAVTDGGHNCFVTLIRHRAISDCSDYAEDSDIWNRNPTITTSPPT